MVRRSGIGEARAVALSAVRVQCKLAHNKDLATHILERSVRLSVLILKNAELADLVRHLVRDALVVRVGDAEKDQESLSDRSRLPPVHMD